MMQHSSLLWNAFQEAVEKHARKRMWVEGGMRHWSVTIFGITLNLSFSDEDLELPLERFKEHLATEVERAFLAAETLQADTIREAEKGAVA